MHYVITAAWVFVAVYSCYVLAALRGAKKMTDKVYVRAWPVVNNDSEFSKERIRELKFRLMLHITFSTLYGIRYLFSKDEMRVQLEDDYLELLEVLFSVDGGI